MKKEQASESVEAKTERAREIKNIEKRESQQDGREQDKKGEKERYGFHGDGQARLCREELCNRMLLWRPKKKRRAATERSEFRSLWSLLLWSKKQRKTMKWEMRGKC